MTTEHNRALAREFFAVREYLDTQHARDVWIAAPSQAGGRPR